MKTKSKAEIVQIVKDNLSGGADKVVQALMDEGCIDASYVSDEGMGDEGMMSDMGDEDTGDMKTGDEDYSIPKGMPMGEARGVAVKFAMKGMDKGKGKKAPPFGKM
jgi:hypothetical protein